MPKNETGEFELVLGNRQLLSGFAIVAILFGVFFAMGYIVGRNSTPSARVVAQDTASGAGTQADAGRAQSPGTPAAQPPPASSPDASSAPPSQASSQPGAEAAQAPAATPAAAPEGAKPAGQPAEPQPGQAYLQVMAVKKPDAEVIVKTLQDKGFPALLAPSPKEGIFRVLVGPYKDSASLGKAKSELENSGFHPFVQR